MVSLRISYPGRRHRCGATIITKQHLLTAAHCTKRKGIDASKISAIYGSTNIRTGSKVGVVKILRHRNFDPKFFRNDIAILLLQQPLNFSSSVLPICLPMKTVDVFHKEVTAAGWGLQSERGKKDSILRFTTLKLLPNSRCYDKFKKIKYDPHIMYCGYRTNTDVCSGDSGGPLMAVDDDGRVFQSGITSYGLGCARKDVPGVYTRVEAFAEWIRTQTADESKHTKLRPWKKTRKNNRQRANILN